MVAYTMVQRPSHQTLMTKLLTREVVAEFERRQSELWAPACDAHEAAWREYNRAADDANRKMAAHRDEFCREYGIDQGKNFSLEIERLLDRHD